MDGGGEHEAAIELTYAGAQGLYRRAGWAGVLPLPAGAKWPPPEGFTGWHGSDPSGADSQSWIDDFPEYRGTRQLALRMPATVIGIDVDHYGTKRGADTMAEAMRRWGPIPIGAHSSARGDGASGIWFYRVPKGTTLRTRIAFPELGLGHIEIIQRHHRYAVVWPSVHPETGEGYRWYGLPSGVIVPDLASPMIPALPQGWLEGLAGSDDPGVSAADPKTVAEFAKRYATGTEPGALRGVLATWEREAATSSRHDAMMSACCMAAREARMGRYAAADARSQLRQAFTLALAEAKPGQRLAGPDVARREFDSMWAWGVSAALGESEAELVARRDRAVAGTPADPLARPSVDDFWTDEGELPRPPGVAPAGEQPGGGDSESDEQAPVQERSSWAPVDLGPILRGEVVPAQASIGMRRSDGVRLLYPGKEHAVAGEMESGKSWLALQCCAAELADGRHVLYIHFEEDDPTDTVTRLLLLGVEPATVAQLFHFVAPAYGATPDVIHALRELRPSLVILDGQNEAMTLHGHGINDPDGPSTYRRVLVRPFTADGAAVLSTDHVAKATAGVATTQMGSVMKGNGLTGTLITLENSEAFGKGRRGASRVYVTKDRPAQVRQHGQQTEIPRKFFMGMLIVDATIKPDERVDLSFYAPADEASPSPFDLVTEWHSVLDDGAILPQEVAELTGQGAGVARDIFRVLAWVRDDDGLTAGQVRQALAEGPRTHSKTAFFRGWAMLQDANITVVGSSSQRRALHDRFRVPGSPSST